MDTAIAEGGARTGSEQETGLTALLEGLLEADNAGIAARLAVDAVTENQWADEACCLLQREGASRAETLAFSPRNRREQGSKQGPGLVTDLSLEVPHAAPGALYLPIAVAPQGRACRGMLVCRGVQQQSKATLLRVARSLGLALRRLAELERSLVSERLLRHERTQLDGIVAALPDPILVADGDGRAMPTNAAARRLFGPPLVPGEGRRRAMALNESLFRAAWASQALGTGGSALFLADPETGEDRLFEQLTARTGAGPAGTVVSMLRDVTDLRRTADELEANYRRMQRLEAESRAERDQMDLIIDAVTDPIVVTAPDGRIVLMNRPAERLFLAGDVAAALPVRQAVRENDRHFSRFMTSLMESAHETRLRGTLMLTDPQTLEPVPVEVHAGKLPPAAGERPGMVTILHDRSEALENARLCTELRRASDELEEKVRAATAELLDRNEQLRRQHLALEQASALKTQFLANMSHEFRTPLNAILGYTAMLLQGVSGDLPAPAKRHLTRVDSNARHLLGIINDILDISRIESGRMPLTLTEFSLEELIAELLAEAEPVIAKSRLVVTAQTAQGLPLVRSDRQKLKQVLLNLVTNALKFTHEGSVTLEAAHDPEGDQMQLRVRDTGIGVAPSDRERIFEDFRQADNSPTREYGGTGLGLAIVRRLTEMLGGQVSLESTLGEGSTFSVAIPRRLRRR